MGQSTDGILVFGIPLEEGVELEFLEDFDNDFEEFVDAQTGKDWKEVGFKEVEAARQEFGITMLRHCSCDYPMYILAITGTTTTAYRGNPQKIEKLVDVSQEQIDKLTAFAEQYGFTDAFEGEPGWYLCSDWC